MGFEIADMRPLGADLSGQLVVYLEGGPNPITETDWETYTPDPGFMLNTPRGAKFDVLNVLGSPFVPTGEFTYHTDSRGFTWLAVAAVQNRIYPFDPDDYSDFETPPANATQAAYMLVTPLPGTIQYNANSKNHENVYFAEDGDGNPKTQHFVTDPWGNVYILKSINAANDTPEKIAAAVEAAVLPEGWTKSTGTLAADTVYEPVYSGNLSHANEFRDSADSAWMQIVWGEAGITLASMVGEGVPIWGGNSDDLLLGTDNGEEMHGGGGNDTVVGGFGGDRVFGSAGDDTLIGGQGDDRLDGGPGNNTLIGGSGTDTALYDGSRADFGTALWDDGAVRVSKPGGEADVLIDVERIEFTDGVLLFEGSGNAPAAYRLYSVFDRAPDEGGLLFWAGWLDAGGSLHGAAASFLASDEFVALHGSSLTDAQFIDLLYLTVLDREGDAGGVGFWNDYLATGGDRAGVLMHFTESLEYVGNSLADIENGYWVP